MSNKRLLSGNFKGFNPVPGTRGKDQIHIVPLVAQNCIRTVTPEG